MLFNKKWDPNGQHCYVTGGSTGLGFELAVMLTKMGANVSIVARNEERLEKALQELEKHRQAPNQILRTYSFPLHNLVNGEAALVAACEPHEGRSPDAAFLCAGGSQPGFLVDQDEESMKRGMDAAYWVQAWSSLAIAKHMVRTRTRGKIVFISSLLGYMSIIGYSNYSPGKHALRGLAETLRSELLLYSISVHIFFPGTMYTPGYIEENKTKPKITLKIEEDEKGLQPGPAAEALLKGVRNGDFHISGDMLGEIFRASTRGATPQRNCFADIFFGLIGLIGLPIWRRSVDASVIRHRREHEEYLTGKGFLKDGN